MTVGPQQQIIEDKQTPTTTEHNAVVNYVDYSGYLWKAIRSNNVAVSAKSAAGLAGCAALFLVFVQVCSLARCYVAGWVYPR